MTRKFYVIQFASDAQSFLVRRASRKDLCAMLDVIHRTITFIDKSFTFGAISDIKNSK